MFLTVVPYAICSSTNSLWTIKTLAVIMLNVLLSVIIFNGCISTNMLINFNLFKPWAIAWCSTLHVANVAAAAVSQPTTTALPIMHWMAFEVANCCGTPQQHHHQIEPSWMTELMNDWLCTHNEWCTFLAKNLLF